MQVHNSDSREMQNISWAWIWWPDPRSFPIYIQYFNKIKNKTMSRHDVRGVDECWLNN